MGQDSSSLFANSPGEYFTYRQSFSYATQDCHDRSLRLGFTRRLMGDLLTVPEFAETAFAFTDINQHNLDMVKQLAERDIAGNDLPAKIVATIDCRTVKLWFRWLCTLVLNLAIFGIGLPTPGRAQTLPNAPVIQSDSRLFALGSPRAIGVFPSIYGIKWQRNGACYRIVTRKQPRGAGEP